MSDSEQLLKTPLAACHEAAGARMVEFGGWWMPVQYEGILAEHAHTRTQVSVFDCSHMGQFRLRGEAVGTALDQLLPRPVSSQKPGTCRYNFLLNSRGGSLDDLIVYRLAADEYYLVVNAGTQGRDAEHLLANLPESVEFSDESANTAKLDLQGPQSAAILEQLGMSAVDLPRYFHFRQTTVNEIPLLLSRTGYTGELGFELYFAADQAQALWDALLQNPLVAPAGLGARDTLRLEMGYPLYGHELDEDHGPIAAGFQNMIDMDHPFIGRDALNPDPARILRGIRLNGRRAARTDQVVTHEGRTVGRVTSGSLAPSLGCAVALAYVDAGLELGTRVGIPAGRKELAGTLCKLPFYREGSVRAEISA